MKSAVLALNIGQIGLSKQFKPFPAFFFVLKMSIFFTSPSFIQSHFRLDFIMEANTMNPNQTAL